MIEVVIADHQDMFRTVIEEVLKVEDGLRMVGEAPCPEQLLNTLQKVSPHVLLLSKSFLPAVTRINPMLERNKTALLLYKDGVEHLLAMALENLRGDR
jgi:DNA-binding NarL/FixJ family response regulator